MARTQVDPHAALRAWRVSKNLTLSALAKLICDDLDHSTVSRWETGGSVPKTATLRARIETITDGFVPAASWESALLLLEKGRGT